MKNVIPEVDSQSMDIVADNISKLKELFPEAFTEGKVDFDALKEVLGNYIDGREERYSFTWNGKSKARMLAQTPSTGTLRPCKEESVDWESTQNLFIEGDNLEVLKLLQKSYHKKVKMIYIDPPYNTGKDFVYKDNFKDNIKNYKEITGQVDGEGRNLSSNPETSGRFHTDWLNMMYPRLRLARNLLKDDGAIFVSIGQEEIANLQIIMNEVFGEENGVVSAVWRKRVSPANDAKWFSSDHDFVVVYAKNKGLWRPNKLARNQQQISNYRNPDNDPRGPWNSATYTCNKSSKERPNLYYAIRNPYTGKEVWPKETAVWKYGKEVTERNLSEDRLYWGAEGNASFPRIKLFLSEMEGVVPRSVWDYDDYGHTQGATSELNNLFNGEQTFDSPKPTKLIEKIIEISCTSKDDIVLDFFAGSGTTGHACYKRSVSLETPRFILVQLPESTDRAGFKSISEMTKERLRRAAAEVAAGDESISSDLGFQVFKLDSTNIKPWELDFDLTEQDLEDQISNIKHGREDVDVLYEVLLKYGLDLTLPITEHSVAGHKVFDIGMGALMICLSDDITLDVVEGIAKLKDELKPEIMRVVFKDAGFADDVVKTNAVQILKQAGIEDVRSL